MKDTMCTSNQITQTFDSIMPSKAREQATKGFIILSNKRKIWILTFYNCVPKRSYVSKWECGCVRACVSVCVCVSILPCRSWQTSDGHAAQSLNQHNITVQQRRRRECFVCKPAERREWHSPCSFCITLAMSTDGRPKCLGEAMSSRRSCNDKVGHWCWRQKILHNCPERDIPSAPPSLSFSLSLSLSLSF